MLLLGSMFYPSVWQPTPVLLPGKSYGRSLVGYSPWGCEESDTTEQLYLLTYLRNFTCYLILTIALVVLYYSAMFIFPVIFIFILPFNDRTIGSGGKEGTQLWPLQLRGAADLPRVPNEDGCHPSACLLTDTSALE